jgi:hypothetical protein
MGIDAMSGRSRFDVGCARLWADQEEASRPAPTRRIREL